MSALGRSHTADDRGQHDGANRTRPHSAEGIRRGHVASRSSPNTSTSDELAMLAFFETDTCGDSQSFGRTQGRSNNSGIVSRSKPVSALLHGNLPSMTPEAAAALEPAPIATRRMDSTTIVNSSTQALHSTSVDHQAQLRSRFASCAQSDTLSGLGQYQSQVQPLSNQDRQQPSLQSFGTAMPTEYKQDHHDNLRSAYFHSQSLQSQSRSQGQQQPYDQLYQLRQHQIERQRQQQQQNRQLPRIGQLSFSDVIDQAFGNPSSTGASGAIHIADSLNFRTNNDFLHQNSTLRGESMAAQLSSSLHQNITGAASLDFASDMQQQQSKSTSRHPSASFPGSSQHGQAHAGGGIHQPQQDTLNMQHQQDCHRRKQHRQHQQDQAQNQDHDNFTQDSANRRGFNYGQYQDCHQDQQHNLQLRPHSHQGTEGEQNDPFSHPSAFGHSHSSDMADALPWETRQMQETWDEFTFDPPAQSDSASKTGTRKRVLLNSASLTLSPTPASQHVPISNMDGGVGGSSDRLAPSVALASPGVGDELSRKKKQKRASSPKRSSSSSRPFMLPSNAGSTISSSATANTTHNTSETRTSTASVASTASGASREEANPDRTFGPIHNERWMQRYQQLVQFVHQHGHALVPLQYKANPSLAHWVKRQRCQYKAKMSGAHSTLSTQRQTMLEGLEFIWDSHRAAWQEKLNELSDFRRQHGHCNVPSRYAANQSLAVWVKCQRRQYRFFQADKKSNMNEERIQKLSNIGFVWNPRDVAQSSQSRTSTTSREATAVAGGDGTDQRPASDDGSSQQNATSTAAVQGGNTNTTTKRRSTKKPAKSTRRKQRKPPPSS